MSAAATAAGYLYASGRLRGRGAREQEQHPEEKKSGQPQDAQPREPIRVAVLPEDGKPRKQPKIEYRVRRRWTSA